MDRFYFPICIPITTVQAFPSSTTSAALLSAVTGGELPEVHWLPLMIPTLEHFSLAFPPHLCSSLEKCLPGLLLSPNQVTVLFCFASRLSFYSSLYTLGVNPLSVVQFVDIFSNSGHCFVTLFTDSFAKSSGFWKLICQVLPSVSLESRLKCSVHSKALKGFSYVFL